MNYSMRIYFKISGRCVKLQKTGSRLTTVKEHIVSLAEYHLETIEHRQKTTLHECRLDGGYYKVIIN